MRKVLIPIILALVGVVSAVGVRIYKVKHPSF